VLAFCGVVMAAQAADAPITISVFSVQNQPMPSADNKIFKLMQDKLGVTFTWDIAVGEKDQKIGVLIASQDYADILDVDSNKFIDAGLIE
jgi:putative aldouronate transport system substrate-binding protein